MRRYLIVAALLGFAAYQEFGGYLPTKPAAVNQTIIDECCDDFAVRAKKFYADGSKKLASGELKTAADAEAYASAGWMSAQKEAFRPIDEPEANAVFAKEWQSEFARLWKEFSGE